MKKWLKENWFKLIITTGIFLISLSVFYYFVIFSPQKEKNRLNQETQEKQEQLTKELKEQQIEEDKSNLLDTCLKEAEAELVEKTQAIVEWGNKETTNENVSEMTKILQKMFDDSSLKLKEDKAECFNKYH
ncbi:MAG: hypothetical protein WDK95_17300 [Syntrophorhabdaceae bacterium]